MKLTNILLVILFIQASIYCSISYGQDSTKQKDSLQLKVERFIKENKTQYAITLAITELEKANKSKNTLKQIYWNHQLLCHGIDSN